MLQPIEVIYEDNVLKPVTPIEGLQEQEKIFVILYSRPLSSGLRELVGTLTEKEAEEMQKLIDEEFGKVEGEW